MNSRILIDTCAAIWLTEGRTLDRPAMNAIQSSKTGKGALFVSPVVAWEIGMLVSKGRLTLRMDPASFYAGLCALPAMQVIELSVDLLIGSSFLPGSPPNDPFDRIIIATARHHGLTIVTRDRLILAYAEAGHVAALIC